MVTMTVSQSSCAPIARHTPPTVYIDVCSWKATVYMSPETAPHFSNQSTIVIHLRDERQATYYADLINAGRHQEVLYRLIAGLYR